MYEHRTHRLLGRAEFGKRVLRHVMLATVVLVISLTLGVTGYHYVGDLEWIDAVLNASMILTGMGPVDVMLTTRAKLFASLYALFSGVVFLGIASVVVAPFAHRLLHRFHLEAHREE